ncbi:uncharacterized protein LOC132065998 [Lycium ferocissimum]|uniref:uncharacterized protein LOC132065998 n=1 Tax=Lycium ferocissimum TaxID=112874 RepID=UPI0028158038|nr:uncharacterized protein LOC132065998 [Lycium ferocissimum]
MFVRMIQLCQKGCTRLKFEDANYVNNSQGGYQRQNYQGGYQYQKHWRPQQGQGAYNNSGNYNNNYGGANQGSYNNSNNFGNKRSNPYILLKGQSTEQETVGSHTAAIQKLESQMRDIFREQHPPKKGGLPSDTISNPKNGGGGIDRVFAITTRSGKILQETDKKVVDLEPIDEEEEVADISEIVKEADNTSKQIIKGALRPLTHLFKSKPPFPQRLVKNNEDAKFEKFYDQLKQLSPNFPFLEVVKEMPDFAKYLKDIRPRKRFNMKPKRVICAAFTIPCSVGHHDFARALCDNGASNNLMPLAIYKQSGLGVPRLTTMRLQMDDRSIKRPVGVVDDVLVRVGEFMLPTDFVILNCAVDRGHSYYSGETFPCYKESFDGFREK